MEEEKKTEELTKIEDDREAMEQLLFYGDLSALSQEQKGKYMFALCKSFGINPWTRPFDFIVLNGKLTVYANKGAAAQLRDVRKISTKVIYEGPLKLAEKVVEGIYQVTMEFSDPTERVSYETGTVSIQGLSGENLANAIMRCWTKAQRRGTLNHAGLGFPDESEVDSIPEVRARMGSPRIIQPAVAPAEMSESVVEAVVTPPVPKAPTPPQTVRPLSNGSPPKVLPAAKPPVRRV